MFDELLRKFASAGREPAHVDSACALLSEKVDGYASLSGLLRGRSLGNGQMRLLGSISEPVARQAAAAAFPEFAARARPVAQDWLGRFYAVDAGTTRRNLMLLLEPGSGEAFEIDDSFQRFFERTLVDEWDEFMEADLWAGYLRGGGQPPTAEQCVGFRVPLFMGGQGTPQNLELTDLTVYWAICGQLRLSLMGHAPGTPINRLVAEGDA